MSSIGVVEGFFGPEWTLEARLEYARFLGQFPNSFYFYAPKRDPHLRKVWRQDWSDSYLKSLSTLLNAFHQEKVAFGVGLSPFGIGKKLTQSDRDLLELKISQLSDLGIDKLGLFFDDMPVSEFLADVQAEVVELALPFFPKGLIFCPSYYSLDPILDKVFGQRPIDYFEKISQAIPSHVSILWTGPKVISEEISHDHLIQITKVLKRKPFIWENLYANDGPRNCKFLKLKNFTGRDQQFMNDIEGMALNLMNQPYLSRILFLASYKVATTGMAPDMAFTEALNQLVSSELAHLILDHRELFLNEGLDKIDEKNKSHLLTQLQAFKSPVSAEISEWLLESYLVGPECLTD